MTIREECIRTALRAWPDNDLLGVDFEKMSFQELVEAAREKRFGDTLLSFVVLELCEGLDEDASSDRAVGLISRAIRDLETVSEALSGMAAGKKEETVTLRAPREAWDLLAETLKLDAKSKAFDPALRIKIQEALKQVREVNEAPPRRRSRR